MRYKVNPLMYAVNENFKNTIRFAIEFVDDIDEKLLKHAVSQVRIRYPYFSVCLKKDAEELVLEDNQLPFVISKNNRAVCLGSSESNYHLLAFSYDKNVISVDVSHNICDGNGIAPLVKTLAYYYIQKRYGEEGIDKNGIRLVGDEISEGEYAYPYPKEPIQSEDAAEEQEFKADPLIFGHDFFSEDGIYAYHLQISQKEFMEKAKTNDGSPVSFISVIFYKAMLNLFSGSDKDIVIRIPHEYRKVLGSPLSHDSLARVMSVKLSVGLKNRSIETLNTIVRGQILLGCDEAIDIKTINGLVQLDGYLQTMPLEGKMQTMQGIVAGSLQPCTCGISYTGKVSWGGMDRYIKDVHVYAGEKKREGDVSIEVFTCGDNFSLCLMQPGKNPSIAQEMISIFEKSGIKCVLSGEGAYKLSDFVLPE